MPQALETEGSSSAEASQFQLSLEVNVTVAVLQSAERARYEIHDHTTVEASARRSGLLDIWSPVIPETPYQRVLDIEVTTPGPWQIHRESEFGNLVFHCQIAMPVRTAIEVQFRYAVERLPLNHPLDAAALRPASTPPL